MKQARDIGQWIKVRRLALNLTLKELSERAGINGPNVVYRAECGATERPADRTIRKLVPILGEPPKRLVKLHGYEAAIEAAKVEIG